MLAPFCFDDRTFRVYPEIGKSDISCSCLTVYLFPFLGIWEPSLRGKGVMTALASSGCTGASWGFGFPLPALRQGALTEGDESPWNDKVTCFSIV